MYFASRVQAGRMLAAQVSKKYRYEKCAVMALNDGGVMIGAQIAVELHCVLTMMVSAEIDLPREPTPVAGITQEGSVAYNYQGYATGELDELVTENYNLIEQEKLVQMHNLNQLLSGKGVIDKDLLKGHCVIIVSDGLKNGFSVDLAMEFLKPVDTKKLIVTVPLASVKAVDRMHVLADDVYCLSVVEDYIDTNHYYDKQDIPDHDTVLQTLQEVVTKWQ